MFEELTRTHPELMQKMRMRYAGPERDEFLERYQDLKASRNKNELANEGLQ